MRFATSDGGVGAFGRCLGRLRRLMGGVFWGLLLSFLGGASFFFLGEGVAATEVDRITAAAALERYAGQSADGPGACSGAALASSSTSLAKSADAKITARCSPQPRSLPPTNGGAPPIFFPKDQTKRCCLAQAPRRHLLLPEHRSDSRAQRRRVVRFVCPPEKKTPGGAVLDLHRPAKP